MLRKLYVELTQQQQQAEYEQRELQKQIEALEKQQQKGGK